MGPGCYIDTPAPLTLSKFSLIDLFPIKMERVRTLRKGGGGRVIVGQFGKFVQQARGYSDANYLPFQYQEEGPVLSKEKYLY